MSSLQPVNKFACPARSRTVQTNLESFDRRFMVSKNGIRLIIWFCFFSGYFTSRLTEAFFSPVPFTVRVRPPFSRPLFTTAMARPFQALRSGAV